MTRKVWCLTLALVLGFALTSAAAVNSYLALGKGATKGADQPIDITGRKLTLVLGDGSVEARYIGNVKVKQGDVTMTCDRLVVDYAHKDARPGLARQSANLAKEAQKIENIRSITAVGNVKIVQHDRIAVAGKAVYDNTKRTIELTDNPMLWQGPDRLHGQKIVFHMDEHLANVDNGVSVTISSGWPNKGSNRSPK